MDHWFKTFRPRPHKLSLHIYIYIIPVLYGPGIQRFKGVMANLKFFGVVYLCLLLGVNHDFQALRLFVGVPKPNPKESVAEAKAATPTG